MKQSCISNSFLCHPLHSLHPEQQWPQYACWGRPCSWLQPQQARPIFLFQCSISAPESAILCRGLSPTTRSKCWHAHIRDRANQTKLGRTIATYTQDTPHCVSSVREKRYTIKIDEQLSDAMLFLSDHRFTAASATFSHCSLWILTELVRITPAALPTELRCRPNASKVTLSLDRSSSGQEYMLQYREAAAPCGLAEPFQQRGVVF